MRRACPCARKSDNKGFMSKFLSEKLRGLQPYIPGEQPKDAQYIKLNTNENPYFPSRYATDKIDGAALNALKLYSDPECADLRRAVASYYGVGVKNVLAANGSDEVLAFCFAAFGGAGAVFPDVTYGFYKVFASLFGVEYAEIPLLADFSVNVGDYTGAGKTIFLANPNAQTGIALPLVDVEKIAAGNPDNVVVIDEAYVDFGGESAVGLTKKYKNLVVVQTFSKSRSLAGARVGFAVADEALIGDLNRVKYSFNPYNVNRLSSVLAAAAMADREYFEQTRSKIMQTRSRAASFLRGAGYRVLPSSANFLLAESPKISGEALYKKLKERGILVRHFADERIKNFVRITVGTDGEIDELLKNIEELEREA